MGIRTAGFRTSGEHSVEAKGEEGGGLERPAEAHLLGPTGTKLLVNYQLLKASLCLKFSYVGIHCFS